MLILRNVAVKQVLFVRKDWSGFDQAAAKVGNFVAKRLFRIMILPDKVSGLNKMV